ncbi:putative reverse transcriptase domain-containing protein, partial [Tanacetum coccineum]
VRKTTNQLLLNLHESRGTLMGWHLKSVGNDKRKEVEESSKQGSTWKDNKKSKTGSGFVATVPPRNKNASTYPRCARCYTFHPENASCKLCYNCQKLGHLAKQCWAPIRQVAPMNAVRIGPN